ncbi:aminotransferase [Gottfriedia acidiceleris]|uniref:aminotransferase n=1 Tax=Gottfriedia acidiceleris TaxID=371036 RepID=UPI002FFDA4F1
MSKFNLSNTVTTLQPSGIRKFFDLAASMDNVISLGVGEPDFVTPWNVREASIYSLETGHTAYTSNAGLLELRQEVSRYFAKKFDVHYSPEDELIITVGASQGIDIALRTILNPGDEVIVIDPCFVSYAPLVSLAGGVPVHLATTGEEEFKINLQALKKKLTPKTKAILLCNPNNPTGTLLEKELLEDLAVFVKKHNLIVISDEIYAELVYDGEYTSFANIDGMRDHTILISGFSKTFAMTGWRLGIVAAPSDIISHMLKVHQYAIMCAPTMSQHAAVEALRNGDHDVEAMRRSYMQRRNFLVQSLQEIGLSCHLPGGAFYVFPSIQNTGLTSEEFAEQLLLKERVAVVPGNVFGDCGEGYIRCSYATSLNQLIEATKRINRFLQTLPTYQPTNFIKVESK